MKYYTPDLLAKFGSDNLKMAKIAGQILEQKAEEYVNRLDEIRPKLPPKLVEMQERFYLHDARIVMSSAPWFPAEFMMNFPIGPWCDPLLFEKNRNAISSFILVLQLDAPPQEFLVLHYRIVNVEEVTRHPSLDDQTPFFEWLHDEVNLIPLDDLLVFEQSILFTNGLELRLRFQDFDYATLRPQCDPSKEKEVASTKN